MVVVITRYMFNVTMAERLVFPDILRYSILLRKEWIVYSHQSKDVKSYLLQISRSCP